MATREELLQRKELLERKAALLSRQAELSSEEEPSGRKGYLFNALRNFASSATAGLSEPVAAGLSAVADEGLQLAGAAPERSLGESYQDYRGKQREDLDQFREENGGTAALTDIAGLVSPGGAFGKIYKGAEKVVSGGGKLAKGIPYIQKLLQKSPRLIEGLGKIAGVGARGGIANATYDAINPETPIENAGDKFLEGAGGDLAATGVINALGAGGKYLGKPILKYGGVLARSLGKKIPLVGEGIDDFLRTIGVQKYGDDLGRIVEKAGADDIIKAGEGFAEKVGKIDDEVLAKYQSIKDPIMQKFGSEKISVEPLRKSIVEKLNKVGLLDSKGNIIKESPLFSGPEGSSYRSLVRLSQSINKNPNLDQVDALIRGFGTKANFAKGAQRSDIDRLFGDLYHGGRESILDASEKFLGPEQAQVFKQARGEISSNLGVLKDLNKLASKSPEKAIRGARSNLEGSKIQNALKVNPSYREPIKQAVLGDIAESATNPKQLEKILDRYGQEPLRELLGPEDFTALQKLAGIYKKDPQAAGKVLQFIKGATEEERKLLARSPAAYLSIVQSQNLPKAAQTDQERARVAGR